MLLQSICMKCNWKLHFDGDLHQTYWHFRSFNIFSCISEIGVLLLYCLAMNLYSTIFISYFYNVIFACWFPFFVFIWLVHLWKYLFDATIGLGCMELYLSWLIIYNVTFRFSSSVIVYNSIFRKHYAGIKCILS